MIDFNKLSEEYQNEQAASPVTVGSSQAPIAAPTDQKRIGFLDSYLHSVGEGFKSVGEVAKGALKGAGSTIVGVGKLAMARDQAVGLDKLWPKKMQEDLKDTKAMDIPTPDILKPKNTYQKIGFTGEQLAEYFLPAGAIKEVNLGVKAATKGLPTIAGALVRSSARAGTEALAAGVVRSSQTGDVREGAKAGAFAGASTGLFSLAGEALRATGISEKLYSQIFKNTYDDATKALKTGALKDLQTKDPERFSELVKSGIIKAGKNGEVTFDPTLAREALDKNLKGPIKTMGNTVVRKTLDLEEQARGIASTYKGSVGVAEPDKMVKILQQFQKEYEGTYLKSKIGNGAEEYIKKLIAGKGKLSGDDALGLRRFLDRMRVLSSYKPDAHVSLSQQNLKAATDMLRGSLNKIPGMQPVMDNYRFYIDALESLGKEAAKRNNSAIINLIDTALFGFGGGLAGPEGAAVLPLTRRALTLPSVVTGIGSKIEQGTKGNIGRAARGTIINELLTKQK